MDVVDLVPLIDRFDNPASVLPYVEHPHPRVRLAVAQWFGPGLVGTDPWIRSKSMDLYPEMRVVERRPDMPIGLFTVLVADPDPDVQMAALRRCWDVSLLVGLVDPRALLAGTAAETAGDPVARLVRVHLLQIRESGGREEAEAAALALDPSVTVPEAQASQVGVRRRVRDPDVRPLGPSAVASWSDWAERCRRLSIEPFPVTRGWVAFGYHATPIGSVPGEGMSAVVSHVHEHLGVLLGHGGELSLRSGILQVLAPVAAVEITRRVMWLEGSYRVDPELAPYRALPPEVVVTADPTLLEVASPDEAGWEDCRQVLERLWHGHTCGCGAVYVGRPPRRHV